MEQIKLLVQFVVLMGFSTLGWLLGYSRHKFIPSHDSITLPRICRFLFGQGSAVNLYDLKGIYLQILAISFAIGFALYILNLVSLYSLSRVFLIFLLIIFPAVEISRIIMSRMSKK